jgi:hypothetical protein
MNSRLIASCYGAKEAVANYRVDFGASSIDCHFSEDLLNARIYFH